MRIPLFFLVVSSMAAVYQRVERHATRAPTGSLFLQVPVAEPGLGISPEVRRAPSPFRMRVQTVYIYPELPCRRACRFSADHNGQQ
jgi:hypothetical protein